jgi:hypothetical protein
MIRTDDQMLLAAERDQPSEHPAASPQGSFKSRLFAARRTILLEVQQRDQDILNYLSSGIEHQ